MSQKLVLGKVASEAPGDQDGSSIQAYRDEHENMRRCVTRARLTRKTAARSKFVSLSVSDMMLEDEVVKKEFERLPDGCSVWNWGRDHQQGQIN